MKTIATDLDLRSALEGMTSEQQHLVGAMFVESALDLCDDFRVTRAIEMARDPSASADERRDVFHSVKSLAVGTYTECGRNTDWRRQAAHFVAIAAACLTSDEEGADYSNRAWRVAMHIRNARNSALITEQGTAAEDEGARQRRITEEFLAG